MLPLNLRCQPGQSDSVAQTYTATATITVAGVSVANTANATVGSFYDSAVSEAASPTARNQIIWAGKINNDSTNFKSTTSDYQLLVPVVAGDTYYFYLEIL